MYEKTAQSNEPPGQERACWKQFDSIERFPHSGRPVPPAWSEAETRKWVRGDWLIRYQIHDDELIVVGVRHGARSSFGD